MTRLQALRQARDDINVTIICAGIFCRGGNANSTGTENETWPTNAQPAFADHVFGMVHNNYFLNAREKATSALISSSVAFSMGFIKTLSSLSFLPSLMVLKA